MRLRGVVLSNRCLLQSAQWLVLCSVGVRAKVVKTVSLPVEAVGSKSKVAVAQAINARHRSWLSKRIAPAGQRDGWRPARRYRVAAEKWCASMDNQLRYSTAWGGLNYVKYVAGDETWAPHNWRLWPCFSCAQDQGPDGLSGHHALAYLKDCNVSSIWDWAHGCCRDLEQALKACNMWTLTLFVDGGA